MTDDRNPEELSLEGIECTPLKKFAEDAYLNYSMSVIRDRALPSVTDGLKPVQRRILYAMAEAGLTPDSQTLKSATTVGNVIGHYHPHGDSACYEAMVLMAQPFSFRYPLVHGEGNWGDAEDPKSYAAYRYTEAKLAKFSNALLSDLKSGCVEWIKNFDGQRNEPKDLPARLPAILLNGTTGIAVGMATDIPPHNLCEVADAVIYLMDHEKATVAELMQFIHGPDYPTYAQITSSRAELQKIYESGRGSVRMRATYTVEKEGIVIRAMPYQVSAGLIEKQISELMEKKKLPLVDDVINASDHSDPCKLIIVPRSKRVKADELMEYLFALTDLETTYRVNLNMLGLDGKPQVKSLPVILKEWLSFRNASVKRRLNYRLEQVNARLHVLEALMAVYLNLDEVLRIVRESEHPKQELMEKFGLDDKQAEYILDTKLRQLARLQEIKIKEEQDTLCKEKDHIEELLSSDKKLKALVKKEIKADKKLYGDERRSEICEHDSAAAVSSDDLIPSTPVTVILSKMGWIRAASGTDADAENMSYRSGDAFLAKVSGYTNETACFISNLGRIYNVDIGELPSARGQGEPLSSKVTLSPEESICSVLIPRKGEFYLVANSKDYGFICSDDALLTRMKAGKAFMTLDPDTKIFAPVKVNSKEDDTVVAVSRQGRILIYKASEIPVLSSGRGSKLISINSAKLEVGADGLAACAVIPEGASAVLHAGKRIMKLPISLLKEKLSSRGRAGEVLPRGYQKVDSIEVIVNSAPADDGEVNAVPDFQLE